MSYAQVVLGPPGSGKSTYCYGAANFLGGIGRRVAVVNLDPANDTASYEYAIDIRDLISLDDVMDELKLGPNGAMLYVMEFLEENFDWLEEQIQSVKLSATKASNNPENAADKIKSTSSTTAAAATNTIPISGAPYFIFDLPGQVELTTHHQSLKNILVTLQRDLDFQLVAVHLVDSHYCTEPAKYISASLLSLSTMLRLELPHVNVLSKMDLLESYGTLHQPLEFYTSGHDIDRLLPNILPNVRVRGNVVPNVISNRTREYKECHDCNSNHDNPNPNHSTKDNSYQKLNKALYVSQKNSIALLLRTVDKAIGYSGPGAAVLSSLPLGLSDQSEEMHNIMEKYSSAFGTRNTLEISEHPTPQNDNPNPSDDYTESTQDEKKTLLLSDVVWNEISKEI